MKRRHNLQGSDQPMAKAIPWPESTGLGAPPPSGRLDDDPALRPDSPGRDARRRRSGEKRLRLANRLSRRDACLRAGNVLGRRPHIWSYRATGGVASVCREGPGLMRRCGYKRRPATLPASAPLGGMCQHRFDGTPVA